MIELSKIAHKPCHYIRLNRSFHLDLMWWRLFLHSWNGISMMSTLMPTYPDLSIISDASGTWGCAAVWDTHWFQLQWGTGPFANSQIASKELLPIIIACGVWGKAWKGRHVLCYCDNVSVLNSRTSKDQSIMHMLCSLFFFEASLGFILTAKDIPGSQNDIADDLSRNRLSSFFTKVPSCRCSSNGNTPGTTVSADEPATRLGILELDEFVQYYFRAGLAHHAQNV